MVVLSEEPNENDVIVIDSEPDSDIEIEYERVVESKEHPISFSREMNMEFPLLDSDYHNVLEEINKDLGISNNMMVFSSNMFDKELPIEEEYPIAPPSLNLQEAHTTEIPKQDYKLDYEKLVEQNRILMNSLNNILECPVCLTMVRSSPVPSCHNGHIICSSCWKLTHLCPLCRVKLHETEKCFSQTANTLLELVTLPCQYQDEGCRATGSREHMEQHGKQCMFRIDHQAPKAPTGCFTPGCSIGRKKKQDKNPRSLLGIRSDLYTIRRNGAASQRRHCDDCNRDFSRSYFNRHTCTHSHSALHRIQNRA